MSNDIVNDAQLDTHGFVVDPRDWSEELAFELASSRGIRRLTTEHWRVIEDLRESYTAGEPDLFPRVQRRCASLHMRQGCLDRLFGDPLVAWQVAGLPRPASGLAAHLPGSELTG